MWTDIEIGMSSRSQKMSLLGKSIYLLDFLAVTALSKDPGIESVKLNKGDL
jgi:hypothetical protein